MKRLKIVLVDDYLGFRRMLASFLKEQDAVELVGEAQDGYEAISLTERTHPDMVLMDLHMPKCNGVEATKTIKQNWPGTKVFMLTLDPTERYSVALSSADGMLMKQAIKHGVLEMLSTYARG